MEKHIRAGVSWLMLPWKGSQRLWPKNNKALLWGLWVASSPSWCSAQQHLLSHLSLSVEAASLGHRSGFLRARGHQEDHKGGIKQQPCCGQAPSPLLPCDGQWASLLRSQADLRLSRCVSWASAWCVGGDAHLVARGDVLMWIVVIWLCQEAPKHWI